MPKDKSYSPLSSTHSRASPYARPSDNPEQCSSKSVLRLVGDKKEWEDTICVICMEHPHNAVLLICSSHEKGCRPYMCDTSSRHSNCLDQYRKTSPIIQTPDPVDELSLSNNIKKLENKLPCPLCRGQISGWMVVEAARSFMNSQSRSCSLETCYFSGSYKELRKHARREHPLLCPTEADSRRQQEWSRMENESTFQDIFGVSGVENEYSDIMDLLMSDDYEPEGDLTFGLEHELEFGDMEDLDFGLDSIPLDMSFIQSDPYFLGVLESLERGLLPITNDHNQSTSQVDNSNGDDPSGESNSNRDEPQPDDRQS